MSDLEQVLLNILSDNNDLRYQSEQKLQDQKIAHPNELFLMISNLSKNSTQNDIRSFCIVFLRKNLSSYSEQSFDNQISLIQKQVLENIQLNLFQSLQTEQIEQTRHQICDTIAEIGGTLDGMEQPWNNLQQNIFSLLLQENEQLIDSGLRILSSYFEFDSQSFFGKIKELHIIFDKGLQNQNPSIQLSTILAMGSFIQQIEYKYSQQFQDLVQALLISSVSLIKLNQDKFGDDILSTLSDISENEPKFFRQNFNMVLQFVQWMVYQKDVIDESLKEMGVNLIISILERTPSIIKKHDKDRNITKEVINLLFYGMVNIDKDIDIDWMRPPEGFKEDYENGEVDNDEIHFGMQGFDRLISSIGENIILPNLSNTVQELIQNEDWRYANAAIMAFSQIGEYIQNILDIKPICDLILKFASHQNCKLRYAVCHFIGQISDDLQPNFQEIYLEQVFELMLILLNDPVPRVQGHAAACLSNFVEGLTKQQLQPYLFTIMNKFFEILDNSCSFVKESIVTTVASFSDTAKDNFIPFYDQSVQFLLQMMEKHQTKEYYLLTGLTIECLTMIGNSVGYQFFQTHINNIIQIMLKIQNQPIRDDIKSYLLSGWQRICLIMGKNFAPYLKDIIPSTYQLLNKVFIKNQNQIQTNDNEEAIIAINMLSVIIDEMEEDIIQFIKPTLEIIEPLCNYATNGEIRQQSCLCLSALVKAVNINNPIDAQNLCKNFIDILFSASEQEFYADIIKDQIHAMKECLEIINTKFLTQQEIQELSNKIFGLMKQSLKRKQENDSYKTEYDDLEEEDLLELENENLIEDNLYLALGELMGTLFKTHRELTLGMVNELYNNFLSDALNIKQSDEMHKFGIFIIDDMIEYLGIELIPDKWPHLCEALLRFSTHKSCDVRQAAAYGIGVLSEKSQSVFAEMAPSCIEKLAQALQVPLGNERPKIYGHCNDNITSALGKIIKTNKLNDNILNQATDIWFNQLPLKYDKTEAIINHELLVNIMNQQQQLIIKNNIQNIYKVIRIYGQILNTKYSNQKINEKIIQNLKELIQNQVIQQEWNQIISELNIDQKEKLEQYLIS